MVLFNLYVKGVSIIFSIPTYVTEDRLNNTNTSLYKLLLILAAEA